MKNGSAQVLPYTRGYVSRVLARSRHYKNTVDKKTKADARRSVGRHPLTVQTLAKHANKDQQLALATHINAVDKWLSVVSEFAPHGR
jgi:predicted urease superfamily metal-dependent hydrolase